MGVHNLIDFDIEEGEDPPSAQKLLVLNQVIWNSISCVFFCASKIYLIRNLEPDLLASVFTIFLLFVCHYDYFAYQIYKLKSKENNI